jgi:cyclic pyranopterin phosphate synthase
MSDRFTHFDGQGQAIMVDVGEKLPTRRRAIAYGEVHLLESTLQRILDRSLEKGDVLGIARIAGIMAAKKTSELIPLCHPLALTAVVLDFTPRPGEGRIEIRATVEVTGATGVEMEALTAVTVAGLTIYDMCKAVDRGLELTSIHLLEKHGGKSGSFIRPAPE